MYVQGNLHAGAAATAAAANHTTSGSGNDNNTSSIAPTSSVSSTSATTAATAATAAAAAATATDHAAAAAPDAEPCIAGTSSESLSLSSSTLVVDADGGNLRTHNREPATTTAEAATTPAMNGHLNGCETTGHKLGSDNTETKAFLQHQRIQHGRDHNRAYENSGGPIVSRPLIDKTAQGGCTRERSVLLLQFCLLVAALAFMWLLRLYGVKAQLTLTWRGEARGLPLGGSGSATGGQAGSHFGGQMDAIDLAHVIVELLLVFVSVVLIGR